MRRQAIVELLFSTGMRSCELVQLQLDNFSADFSVCAITSAKHGIDHDAFLGKPAIAAMLRYCKARGLRPHKDGDALLFPGRKVGKPISYCTLRRDVYTVSKLRIGCPVTPHVFRHTFATQMLLGCGCIRSVQLLLGHVNISNTARYCSLEFDHLLQAVRAFHPHGGKDKNGSETLDRNRANA